MLVPMRNERPLTGVRYGRRLVALPGGRAAAPVLVCGHCAVTSAFTAAALLPAGRVCRGCGLGLRFVVAGDLAPADGDPFLLVDGGLRVCGVSRAGERLLGFGEVALVGRPLTAVLHADGARDGADALAARVAVATAGGACPGSPLLVRPPERPDLCWSLRVAPCGPMIGALLVLGAT